MPTGEVGHWDAFLSDHHCKEKRLLEESIKNLTLQQDMYLQFVQKAYISLTGISDALSSFNLPGSLID